MTQRLTRQDIEHCHAEYYHAHGYVLLHDFLQAEELQQVHQDIEQEIPGWQ